jgi:hypothetical protein
MAASVIAYFKAGWTRPWFDWLAQLKQRGGYIFSILAAMVAGGLLPEVCKIVFFQGWRPALHNLRDLAFNALYWGVAGFTVDALYRAQTVWFGSGVAWSTLAPKVFVDQFLYNPLYAAPAMIWAYEWRRRGFRFRGMGDLFTPRFYAARIFPTLLATWGVWIPLVTLIYALPPMLQTPLFSFALTFWVLMVTYITSAKEDGAAG